MLAVAEPTAIARNVVGVFTSRAGWYPTFPKFRRVEHRSAFRPCCGLPADCRTDLDRRCALLRVRPMSTSGTSSTGLRTDTGALRTTGLPSRLWTWNSILSSSGSRLHRRPSYSASAGRRVWQLANCWTGALCPQPRSLLLPPAPGRSNRQRPRSAAALALTDRQFFPCSAGSRNDVRPEGITRSSPYQPYS
jgi:hypothetical protein